MFLNGENGAQAVADSLGQNVNANSLFDIIFPFIPWVASIILFVFIFTFISKKYHEIRYFWKGY